MTESKWLVRECNNFKINSLIDLKPVQFWQEGGSWIVIVLKHCSSKAVLDAMKFTEIATRSSDKYGAGEVKAGLC